MEPRNIENYNKKKHISENTSKEEIMTGTSITTTTIAHIRPHCRDIGLPSPDGRFRINLTTLAQYELEDFTIRASRNVL